ncbi:hypothetical protein RQP46_003853 [Phenoliferia psychrophenolica]
MHLFEISGKENPTIQEFYGRVGAATLLSSTQAQGVAPPIDFKTACNYLVLATSAITTGSAGTYDGHFAIHPTDIGAIQNPGGLTVVTDEIYYSAYTGIKGFVWGPGDVSGTAHQDMMNAYTDGYTRAPTQAVDTRSTKLGGQTFTAGIYQWSSPISSAARSAMTISGAPGDVFIFQAPRMTTGAQSQINMVGGVTAATVYWVLASTLTLGTQSNFVGNALCGSASTAGSNVVWDGAVFAQSAVTMGASVVMSNTHSTCAYSTSQNQNNTSSQRMAGNSTATSTISSQAMTSSTVIFSSATPSSSVVSSSTIVATSSSAFATSSSAFATSSSVVLASSTIASSYPVYTSSVISSPASSTPAPSATPVAASSEAAPAPAASSSGYSSDSAYNSYNATSAPSNSTADSRWKPRGATWML